MTIFMMIMGAGEGGGRLEMYFTSLEIHFMLVNSTSILRQTNPQTSFEHAQPTFLTQSSA